VGLEQGPLNLVSIIEELLERKSSGYGLEIWECGRRDPSLWPCGSLYPQTLPLTSPTSGGCLVGIVRSWTQTTEFVCFVYLYIFFYRLLWLISTVMSFSREICLTVFPTGWIVCLKAQHTVITSTIGQTLPQSKARAS
jgi:hypothetical protein